jgi:ATP synthase protein I
MKKNDIIANLKELEGRVAAQKVPKKQGSQNMLIIIITELMAGIFVGAIIGYYTDKYFNTLPIFLALFSIMGFFASLLNIYRDVSKNYNGPR